MSPLFPQTSEGGKREQWPEISKSLTLNVFFVFILFFLECLFLSLFSFFFFPDWCGIDIYYTAYSKGIEFRLYFLFSQLNKI